MSQTYQDLEVWQVSMDLVESVYRLTRSFPEEEKYGLTSQMRRAAVSLPSNVAEGYGRSHRGDYLRHLSIARGSAKELETQLLIAARLGYVTQEQMAPAWSLSQRAGQMLTKLRQALAE